MPITDYSTTPASNVSISGINIAEGCPPGNINDAIRQHMADMASWRTGGVATLFTAGGTMAGNYTFSGVVTLSNALAVTSGGTGATSAAGARTSLGATTVGAGLFTLADPSAIRFLRVNADNSVSALSDADFRTAIGGGTVSSVDLSGGTTGLSATGGPVTGSGTLTLAGTLALAHGGTGATDAAGARAALGAAATGAATASGLTMATARLLGRTTAGAGALEEITVGANMTLTGGTLAAVGTVTSVQAAGGTTGLTFSGGPVTSSGTLTLGGTLAIAHGGTGAATATAGFDALAGVTSTAFGRGALAWADAAAGRAGLGLGTLATLNTAAVGNGGTGLTATPTNGQVLIGNGSGFALATITAGAGVSVTNGAGTITIAATGGGGTVTSVSGAGTVNGIALTGTVTNSGNLTLGGALSGVSLTTQVAGTLPVGNGGTGTATVFTGGSVVFMSPAGSSYAQDNANFFWDNSAKRLGIGTASPGFPLTVAGEARASKFTTANGSQSLADSTDLTVLTVTGATPPRLWLVTVNSHLTLAGDMTVALVRAGNDGGGGPDLSVTKLATGTTTDVTVSGGNVRVRQTTGISQTVDWSITRLM